MSLWNLDFKIATEPGEFEQIHRLNYKTFVEEIPQHPANESRMLVDKFHEKNTYFICMNDARLVGMLAMCDERPFSLDQKLDDLDTYLPAGCSVCEFRLLAVEPDYRHTSVFAGLFKLAAKQCIKRGRNLGIMSGTTRQVKLYRRMGFTPFGPLVGADGAKFQPMYVTLDRISETLESVENDRRRRLVSFLPGPVNIRQDVRDSFATPAESHRGAKFMSLMAQTKELLCRVTQAASVEITVGSGTLANDMVGSQIRLLECRGLLLTNGEFGNRLIDHAERHGLAFDTLSADWGKPYDYDGIDAHLTSYPEIRWIWTTHCETSTGVLNDMARLANISDRHGVRLCMDCTSSLGVIPLDFSRLWLASSVSGKGLGAFPGLCMVFYNHEIKSDRRLPRYLDLGYYVANEGVPFTHSSNLMSALNSAVHHLIANPPFEIIERRNQRLREELLRLGFDVMTPPDYSSPAVISIIVPPPASSMAIGEDLERQGHLLSYRSAYLQQRNIIQICLMGENDDEHFQDMLYSLIRVAAKHHVKH